MKLHVKAAAADGPQIRDEELGSEVSEDRTDEKLFECSVCGRKFKHLSNKYRHQSLCGKDKKFECSRCSKKFSRKDNLLQHVKQVHRRVLEGDGDEAPLNRYILKIEVFTPIHR